MLDYRVESFLQLCKDGSYTKAAENLGITQPAVSGHIRALEAYYQCKLFRLERRTLILTPEGAAIRDRLTSARNDELDLIHSLSAASKTPTLNLGCTLTAGEFIIAQPLANFIDRHKETHVNITAADTQRLLSQLRDGDIHCAVVEGFFDKSGFNWKSLGFENMVCVSGASSKLADGLPHTLSEITSSPLFIREEGSGSRAVLEHGLSSINRSLAMFDNTIRCNSIGMIKTMVENGNGVTFLYLSAVKKEIAQGSLVTIALSDLCLHHEITFIWRTASILEPLITSLYSELISSL